MAYRSGLFNSVNGDRKYQAAHFAEYFATFIGNGVFPNPSNGLQVYAKENMTVTIKPGKAWINGYYFVNDSDCDLKIENADGVLKRKDRIVLRFDTSTRLITPQIRKGVFSASPVAPTIQRDGDAYELALATVSIEKGTVTITQASIVDERLDTTVCGIVHGVVDQVDTATLFSQYQTWYAEKMEQYNTLMTNAETSFNNQLQAQQTAFDNQSATNQSAFDTQLSDNQSAFDNQTIVNQQTFDDWLASLQTILDGDVAGNLLNILNDLGNEVTNLKSGKGQKNGLASLDETGNVPITQLENVEDIFNSFSQKHNTILLNKRQLLSDLCANIENELRVSPIISALNFTEISTLMSDSSFFSIYYTYNSYSVDKTSGSVSTDEFGNYIFSLVGSYDSSGFSRTLNFETNAVYDFSKIDSLDFKVNLSSQGGTYAKIYVEIDDVEVYSKYGTDSSLPAELSIHIDTANINSKSKFSIKFYVLKNMYSLSGVLESVRINYQENVVNNVSLNSINELYLTKPSEQNNIVIPYIINADNDFIKWGSLIAFTTQPTDTFITFDILDEFNNLLVKDLINTDKIHHIKQTKLKIRINFSGNLLMNASVGKIALTSYSPKKSIETLYDITLKKAVSIISFDDLSEYDSLFLDYIPNSTSTNNITMTYNEVKTASYNYTGTNNNTIVGNTSANSNIPILSGLSRYILIKIDNSTINRRGNAEILGSLKTGMLGILNLKAHTSLNQLISSIQLTADFPEGSRFIVRGGKEWEK